MTYSILAVGIGGSVGALLRWLLSMSLNALFPAIPLGTLVSNLAGGYLMGIVLTLFGSWPSVSPEWRLFIMTGFLGGLTTFSTFSAEMMLLLQQGRFTSAALGIAAHVGGSLLMVFAGMATAAVFVRG